MKSTGIPGALVLCTAVLASSCGGGGRYGYARTYTYFGDEARFARQANNEAVYDEVRRLPDRFNTTMLSWFGVVTELTPGAGGTMRVALNLRTHQERHLCEDETDGSCRVTVSEADGGPFSAALTAVSAEDSHGENRIQVGSLIHVYGRLVAGEYDARGGPVVRAEFYRHWPRGQYVTTASRGSWRR